MDHSTHNDHGQASDTHGSHDRHAGHSVAMFRDKFWLSFALTIPVVFWSADVQHWLGYTAPSFPSVKYRVVSGASLRGVALHNVGATELQMR
jgi:hypothetical protein